MFGHVPTRDLPVVAIILALAVVERVVESWWCRLAAMGATTAAVAWLLVVWA